MKSQFDFNRYRRKRPKLDASIFDSALSHTRRSNASEKRQENSVSTFGRFRLWTCFESSPVPVKIILRPKSQFELKTIFGPKSKFELKIISDHSCQISNLDFKNDIFIPF